MVGLILATAVRMFFFHLKATSFLKGDTATDLGVVKISFDLLPVYHTVQQSSE